MSDSFEDVLKYEREISPDDCRECLDEMLPHIKKTHDHELRAAYHRGYVEGQHVKDADRYAAALRLQRLDFDGGSHENLGKIARAVYPCATAWTVDTCRSLRDEIVRLLGGVTTTVTTKEDDLRLEDERMKAVENLRDYDVDNDTYDAFARAIGVGQDECIRTRLIHLLGGCDCETTNKEQSHGLSDDNGRGRTRDAVHPVSNRDDGRVTAELRGAMLPCVDDKWLTIERDAFHAIADRIDDEFDRIIDDAEATCRECMDVSAEQEVNRLRQLLEVSYAKNRTLKAHIHQMEGGSRRWREKYEDVMRERDEILAKLRAICDDGR